MLFGAPLLDGFDCPAISRLASTLSHAPSQAVLPAQQQHAGCEALAAHADEAKLVRALEHHAAKVPVAQGALPRLLFFPAAVSHVARLARALAHPAGHAVLLGEGGSGKRVLARLAIAIAGFEFAPLATAAAAPYRDFREELKAVFQAAGGQGRCVALYAAGPQLAAAERMEDISCVLHAGAVPGLFTADERAALFAKMQDWFKAQGVGATQAAMHEAFARRARANLRVVLAMSPASPLFRAHCTDFPALVNCCTIDWYAPWPEGALRAVAAQVLAHEQALQRGADGNTNSKALAAIPALAAAVHASVDGAAAELARTSAQRVHTTPQSFLNLLAQFARMAGSRRSTLAARHAQVLRGLQKLQQAKDGVVGMEQELTALRPQLDAKSDEAEALVAKVAEESAAAESIRAAVAREEAGIAARTHDCEARSCSLLSCLVPVARLL